MRAVRWAVVVAAVCLVVAIVAVAYAAGAGKAAPVLRAQRFELVDEDGKVWASLGFEGRQVGLRLLDTEGEARASLLLREEKGQPELSLRDEKKSSAEVNLRVLTAGPQLVVRGADGVAQACLDVKKGSQPGLALFGEDGKAGVVIMTGATGSMVAMRDETGDPRLVLATFANGESDLCLGGAGTEAAAELVTRADGSAAMVLRDAGERPRAAMQLSREGAAQRTESSLVLLDKDGKTLWQAP